MLFTSGSNSQALKAILSQYASQSNRLSMLQTKESPLGAAIKLPWTRHRGGVLNAGKDYFFGKHFRRSPVKTFTRGNTCVRASMYNRVFYTSQKVRIRVVRCLGVSFISTRRGFLINAQEILVQSGFYTSQKV